LLLLERRLRSYGERANKTKTNFSLMRNNINPKIEILTQDSYSGVIPHYATIKIHHGRFALSEYLAQKGIATVWNYYPLYKYEAYNRFVNGINLSETELTWRQVLSLPFKYPLTEKDVMYIINQVNNFYDN
jgi:dTDP-4-amino-4,6-dideoxygalactose transaminase